MTLHTPYADIFHRPCDFLVSYRIKPDEALKAVIAHQGMRCDFSFDRGKTVYMIYPEILDNEGEVILDKNQRIKDSGTAKMWIVLESEKYVEPLKNQLYIGQTAFWRIGGSVLAEVVVVDIFI